MVASSLFMRLSCVILLDKTVLNSDNLILRSVISYCLLKEKSLLVTKLKRSSYIQVTITVKSQSA